MTAASGLRHSDLTLMTFDEPSNAGRTPVESKSNRNYNHRIMVGALLFGSICRLKVLSRPEFGSAKKTRDL